LNFIKAMFVLSVISLTACTTTGSLKYTNAEGEEKLGCEFEFVGSPSVDKYAVEYALSLCAKSAVKKGYAIKEEYLLDLDLTLPKAPKGKVWTHDLAENEYDKGLISVKEYGYLVAYIDLGLNLDND